MILFSDDGVEDGQQFAHGGHDGDHLLFAGGEALIVRADHGVVSGGREGGHVQRGPDVGASAGGGAMASRHAAVAVDRRDPHQPCDLLPRAAAQATVRIETHKNRPGSSYHSGLERPRSGRSRDRLACLGYARFAHRAQAQPTTNGIKRRWMKDTSSGGAGHLMTSLRPATSRDRQGAG